MDWTLSIGMIIPLGCFLIFVSRTATVCLLVGFWVTPLKKKKNHFIYLVFTSSDSFITEGRKEMVGFHWKSFSLISFTSAVERPICFPARSSEINHLWNLDKQNKNWWINVLRISRPKFKSKLLNQDLISCFDEKVGD